MSETLVVVDGVKHRYLVPDTAVAVAVTCVAELAFPVNAPTKLFDVITPEPPTPAPIVIDGVLGLHAIAVAATLFIWIP
jgi:hypothetical protein